MKIPAGALQESGVTTLRTDQQGAVRVVTDGHGIRVSCFVGYKEKDNAEAQRTQSSSE